MMKHVLFLVLILTSINTYCQSSWFMLMGGAILTDPKVSIVNADDTFNTEGLKAGYRIGIIYDRYLDKEKKLGFRTGFNVVKKRYSTQFDSPVV
jgi:hypothetical protein